MMRDRVYICVSFHPYKQLKCVKEKKTVIVFTNTYKTDFIYIEYLCTRKITDKFFIRVKSNVQQKKKREFCDNSCK